VIAGDEMQQLCNYVAARRNLTVLLMAVVLAGFVEMFCGFGVGSWPPGDV
jgi:hypothetical protein